MVLILKTCLSGTRQDKVLKAMAVAFSFSFFDLTRSTMSCYPWSPEHLRVESKSFLSMEGSFKRASKELI
jgi:hypothetical protein